MLIHFSHNSNVINIQDLTSCRNCHQNNAIVADTVVCLFTILFLTFLLSKENPNFI